MIRALVFICALTAVNAQFNIFDGVKQLGDFAFGGIVNATQGVGKAFESVADTGIGFVKEIPLVGGFFGGVADTVKNTVTNGPKALADIANGGLNLVKQIPLIGPAVGFVTDTFNNVVNVGPQALIGALLDILRKVFEPVISFIQNLFPSQHAFLSNGGTIALIAGLIMKILSFFI